MIRWTSKRHPIFCTGKLLGIEQHKGHHVLVCVSSSKCTYWLFSAVCMALSSLPEHNISRKSYSTNQIALLQKWLQSLGAKVINQNGAFILLILPWESPNGHFLSLFCVVLNNLPGKDRYDGKVQESEPHFKYLRPQTPELNNLQDRGEYKKMCCSKAKEVWQWRMTRKWARDDEIDNRR